MTDQLSEPPIKQFLVILAICFLLAGLVVFVGLDSGLLRATQPASFHDFAGDDPEDWRPGSVVLLSGLPNSHNVLSNVAYGLVALLGLIYLGRRRYPKPFGERGESLPYWAFFIGIGVVAVFSGLYHLRVDPDDPQRSADFLVFDRMGMCVSFASFFVAVIADRVDKRFYHLPWLALAVSIAVGALLFWHLPFIEPIDDQRALWVYHFFNPVFPAFVIIAVTVFFDGTITRRMDILIIGGLYALAIFYFEAHDRDVYEWILDRSNIVLSGHTIKHLLSAAAALWVLVMLRKADRRLGSHVSA